MISRLPPTHLIGEKQPSKVKFQPALECVGVDLELRSKKFPSILDPDKCVEINCIDLTCKLTPTEVKNFLARFSIFGNFFKNVLEYQNCSKFARGPDSTYSLIWVNKNWGSEKVGNSLFLGPIYQGFKCSLQSHVVRPCSYMTTLTTCSLYRSCSLKIFWCVSTCSYVAIVRNW